MNKSCVITTTTTTKRHPTQPRASFDVIIVGASIAGTTAATLLSRHNVSVLLIDKLTFPRTKPCGEGLSHAGLRAAQDLELLDVSDHQVSPLLLPFNEFQVTAGNRTRAIAAPGGPGVTVERYHLDSYLLNQATRFSSLVARMGVRAAVQLSAHSPLYPIEVRLGQECFVGRNLVIADGARSTTARTLGIPEIRHGEPRCGASQHWEGTFSKEPHQVGILIADGYELYATPLRNGRLNVAVLTPERENGCPPLSQLLAPTERSVQQLLSSIGFVGTPHGQIEGRVGIGNVRRESNHERIFLAGDALEEFDPIGGMGMTHAFTSGSHVAQTILSRLNVVSSDMRLARRQSLNPSSKTLRRFTNATYQLMRAAYTFPALLSVASTPIGNQLLSLIAPD